MKNTLTPFLKISAPDQLRSHSRPPGGSTLTTSAPRSARNCTPEGPSRNCVNDTTRTPARIASGGRPSNLYVHALENVRGGGHEAAAIGRDCDAREHLALGFILLGDFVVHRHRVAEEERRRKAHAIVAVRDPGA